MSDDDTTTNNINFPICYPGYRQNDIINQFVRKIMALPFLPAQGIQSMFVTIKSY